MACLRIALQRVVSAILSILLQVLPGIGNVDPTPNMISQAICRFMGRHSLGCHPLNQFRKRRCRYVQRGFSRLLCGVQALKRLSDLLFASL